MYVDLVTCKDSDGSDGSEGFLECGQGSILFFELLMGEEFVAGTCNTLGHVGDIYFV